MNTIQYYVGPDWSDDHHDLVIIDTQGSVVAATRFDYDLQGWQAAIGLLAEHGRPPVAIELTHGIGIQKLLEAEIPVFPVHPDSGLFGSLPGLGPKLAPRLLSELGADRSRFEDPTALQCYAGTAPVTKRSGQITTRVMRHAVNKELRCAVHLWANLSQKKCAWTEAYYRAHRENGKSHACALRCLGQRWLKILWRMWQDQSPYNEAIHLKNQVKHGSWNLQLNPQ